MRPLRLSLWCSVLMLAGASQAQAAWDNVFQVTCFGCFKKPAVQANYYAPPPPSPCSTCQQPCQPSCTTQYYLRSYYQPVTTYRTSCYYEPVTTYRTSYYYEPVVSYRYSSYYDPCTCSCQQRAVPVTSYQLRAQSCPVTTYLQRTQLVPETVQKLSYYYEPVTQCCQTTVGAPIPATPGAPPPSGPPAPGGPSGPGGVQESPYYNPPPSGVTESSRSLPNGSTSIRPPLPDTQSRYTPQSPDNGGTYRQPALQSPVPAQPVPAKETQPPPIVRIDRIVKADDTPNVEGQVVLGDSNPRSGARVEFVSADQLGAKQTVTADEKGEFKVNLSSGGWLVYIHDENGKPVYKEKVEVKENQPCRMVLTSR